MLRKRVLARIFSIHDWNVAHAGPNALVYRPGVRTFLRRLGFTMVALVCAVSLHSLRSSSTDSHPSTARSGTNDRPAQVEQDVAHLLDEFGGSMSPEERRRVESNVAARQAARMQTAATAQEERLRTERHWEQAYWAVLALLVALGVLPPLAVIWQQLTIGLSAGNTLIVRTGALWPRTCYIPLNEYCRITVAAVERIHGKYRARVTSLGYKWRVNLEKESSAFLGNTDLRVFSFEVHRQRRRPVPDNPLPERVAVFLSAIERMTGLCADSPATIMDHSDRVKSWIGPRNIVTGSLGTTIIRTPLEKPTAHTATYSIEDLPPQLRQHVDALLAEGGGEKVIEFSSSHAAMDDAKTIRYRDEHGVVHEYRSLDEMPSEIRALFEHMRDVGR